jgi:uncharacterized protein
MEFLLFFLGLGTGFIGTNTGGSTLVTIPLMISLGIPPQSAVATARVATVGTMVAGLRQFHKKGMVDYQLALPGALCAIIGSLCGAYLLLVVPIHLLQKCIGILTLLFTLLSFLKKKESTNLPPSQPMRYIGYGSFFLTGLIGGFFGGQAILATYVFLLIFNKSLLESIGTRKITGLAVLILGTLIGSTIGSRFALEKGDAWIQPLFTLVSIGLSLKLIFF